MTRSWWDKLWADLDRRCQESDFDWKAQKEFIERKINRVTGAVSVTTEEYCTVSYVCGKCGVTFGPGQKHTCGVKK